MITKTYKILLTQELENNPIGVIQKNELSDTPSLTRLSTGNYRATLTGAFPVDKTFIILNNSDDACNVGSRQAYREDDDNIRIVTTDSENYASDNMLSNTALLVEVTIEE